MPSACWQRPSQARSAQAAPLVHFGAVPVAQLRADALTNLSLVNKTLMLPELVVLARLMESSHALAELDLSVNGVTIEGALVQPPPSRLARTD